MEFELTVILDLPEMQRDLITELPSPVRLKRNSSIVAFALLLGATQKETPPAEVESRRGEGEEPCPTKNMIPRRTL